MKVRTGFVSNSSSSSFLMVGTSWGLRRFLEHDGFKFYGYYEPKVTKETERGCDHPQPKTDYCPECGMPAWITEEEEEDVEWDYLNQGCQHVPDTSLLYVGDWDVEYIGIEIRELLETCTLPQAKKRLQEIIKERYGVDVPIKSIHLINETYG